MKAIVKTLEEYEDRLVYFTEHQNEYIGKEIEVIPYDQHLLDFEPQDEVCHVPNTKQNNYFMQKAIFAAGCPIIWVYHKDWLDFVDRKEPRKFSISVEFTLDLEIQDENITLEEVVNKMKAKFYPNVAGAYITGHTMDADYSTAEEFDLG